MSVSRAVTTLLGRFTTVKPGSLAPEHVALELVLRWLDVFAILPINTEKIGPGTHLGLSYL